ncbi:hypothetical protein COLO4_11472 [Corchorus olitorius]|uniref:Uncharacterized protein n=1 Tax=Corchorus olitorius TaxID=93759 RepID=A0A1R3K4L2_9ROSI|nr:hypothetical protein COLO4_11472 [Corchorus olitorius]
MVAVFNKELLSWYLITLKLRETVESGIPRTSTGTNKSLDLTEDQSDHQLHKQQHVPSDSLQVITINEDDENPEKAAVPQESEWIISIKEKLDQARQDDAAGSWARLSIYRVPHYLREGDIKAYVPQIVSLGPYHHGKRRLRQMDPHKWRSLHRVLKRTNQEIQLYLDSMKELEEKTRACYEGTITLSSNEFVEMLVLDGCFILELFQGAAVGFERLGYSRNDPVFAMRGSMHAIHRDMIMLENQIPLFVLDKLLGIQLGEPDHKGKVARLAIRFFDPLMPTDEPLSKSDMNRLGSSLGHTNTFDPFSDLGGLHCLDVFRRSLLRSGPKPIPRVWLKKRSNAIRVADKRRQQLIHCVSELREAGIKFKKRKTDRFWDIKFKDGILRIPRLLIHDGTKSLFLNLISFEQCHIDCSNDITSYVIFMDNLINSHEDVAYLHYFGIIEHWLGSDAEVADLFNRLCQEVVFDINNSYLSHLSEDVNRYYNNRWNTWRAALKHRYFNNPWAIISLFAAFILLLLTFAQTFYGIYGYYRPPS